LWGCRAGNEAFSAQQYDRAIESYTEVRGGCW
jgi:hypothetical protein